MPLMLFKVLVHVEIKISDLLIFFIRNSYRKPRVMCDFIVSQRSEGRKIRSGSIHFLHILCNN